MDNKPIIPVAAPWKLKGDVYIVSYWNKKGNLPDYAFSPLEKSSPTHASEESKHVGGLSQIQVIRYTESPVGPYDELIVCPGSFEYQIEENGVLKTKKAPRISRIYVSQKYTCWNGRKNWNIPKHLARFEFKDLPGGGISVKVYPHDTTNDPLESSPSDVPFFQTTIQPVKWLPAFPFSLSWFTHFMDIDLVQPPLPEAKSTHSELVGTEQWCSVLPVQSTRRAMLAWADMNQKNEKGVAETAENFWPGFGRWQIALKLEKASIDFGLGKHWDVVKANL